MAVEAVHEVARGRVWTGADAPRERGLVDELGDLQHAAAVARRRSGLPADADLVNYRAATGGPRLRPPRSSDDPLAAAAAFDPWGSMAALAARLGLPATGPLVMPPVP